MAEGLPLNEPAVGVANNVDSDESEYEAINPPVCRDKKKTIKQRKKQLRLKQEEQKRNEAREQKKKALDICKWEYLCNINIIQLLCFIPILIRYVFFLCIESNLSWMK